MKRPGPETAARIRLCLVPGLLASLLCLPSAPLQAGEPLRWTVREAVTHALANSPETAVSRNRVEELKESRGEVFSRFLPNLSFEAGYRYIDNVPQIDIDFHIPTTPPTRFVKEVEVGANDNYSFQLQLTQILFASGRVYYAHRAAGKRVEAGRFQDDATRLHVARRAAEAYHGLGVSRSVVDVQQEALDAARAHHDHVRARFEAGAATRLELLRSRVEVANRVSALTEAERNLRTATVLFHRATGLSEDVRVEPSDPPQPPTAGEPPAAALIEAALAARPEIRGLERTRSALEDQARAERGRMLPALSFFGGFTVQKPYFSLVDWEEIFTVGAGLTVPLFDGLSSYRGMRRARAAAETASLSAVQARADVRAEVETALIALEEARARIPVTEENVESALAILAIAENTYAAGAATSLEVIDAQLAANRARLDRLKALYDYRVACVRLAHAAGDLEGIWREEAWQSGSYPSS